jgi:hypothetical protein
MDFFHGVERGFKAFCITMRACLCKKMLLNTQVKLGSMVNFEVGNYEQFACTIRVPAELIQNHRSQHTQNTKAKCYFGIELWLLSRSVLIGLHFNQIEPCRA